LADTHNGMIVGNNYTKHKYPRMMAK